MHSINHSFHSFDWSNNIFLFIFSLLQTHAKAKGTSMMDTSANWAILRTYPNSYVITSTCWETIDPSSTPTMSASNPPSDCTRKLSISGHIWQVSNQSAHRHWKPVTRELASWQLSARVVMMPILSALAALLFVVMTNSETVNIWSHLAGE